jgi:hypothetical protein|tara:strand:- start:15516 stop:15830 length:315 start_codon:yes stop_codon:yes gene_type:complete
MKMDNQIKIPEFNEEDKRDSIMHDFDKDKEIAGKLKDIVLNRFESETYIFETSKGLITIGSYAVLKSKILKDDINKFIKIVYKGNSTNDKGQTYKDFEVFVKNG